MTVTVNIEDRDIGSITEHRYENVAKVVKDGNRYLFYAKGDTVHNGWESFSFPVSLCHITKVEE